MSFYFKLIKFIFIKPFDYSLNPLESQAKKLTAKEILNHQNQNWREWLVLLALTPMTGLFWIFLVEFIFHLLSWRGVFASFWSVARAAEPPNWVFWFLNNNPMSLVAIGILGAMISTLLFILFVYIMRIRSLLFLRFFLLVPIVLLNFVGLVSFEAAIIFWILSDTTLCYLVLRATRTRLDLSPNILRDIKFYQNLNLLVSILFLIFVPAISAGSKMLVSSALQQQDGLSQIFDPNYRFLVLLFMQLTFVLGETFASMLFFHFYFARK